MAKVVLAHRVALLELHLHPAVGLGGAGEEQCPAGLAIDAAAEAQVLALARGREAIITTVLLW